MNISGLMRPHFWQRFGVKNVIRNMLKQNIFCKLTTHRVIEAVSLYMA